MSGERPRGPFIAAYEYSKNTIDAPERRDRDGRIFLTQIYPTEKDSQKVSKQITELLKVIDEYIGLIIDFISNNKDKTNLKHLNGDNSA